MALTALWAAVVVLGERLNVVGVGLIRGYRNRCTVFTNFVARFVITP